MQDEREYGVDVERELADKAMFLDDLPEADAATEEGFRQFAEGKRILGNYRLGGVERPRSRRR